MNCAFEMSSCGMIHITSFMTIVSGIHIILRVCVSNFRGSNTGNGLRCHDVHIKFMKIDPGIRKSLGGKGIHLQTQQADLISLHLDLAYFPCF
jgi:hypothetical protein